MKFEDFITSLQTKIRLFQWDDCWYNIDSITKIEWEADLQTVKIHFSVTREDLCQVSPLRICIHKRNLPKFLKTIGGI